MVPFHRVTVTTAPRAADVDGDADETTKTPLSMFAVVLVKLDDLDDFDDDDVNRESLGRFENDKEAFVVVFFFCGGIDFDGALEDDAKNNTAALLDDDVNDDSARMTYSYSCVKKNAEERKNASSSSSRERLRTKEKEKKKGTKK